MSTGFAAPHVDDHARVAAAAPPSASRRGSRLFITDGDNPEWYYYDPFPRDKWLSYRAYDLFFSAPSSRSGHLDFHSSRQGSATIGHLLEYNMTLVQMTILRNGTTGTETYRLTASGTDIAQTAIAAGASTSLNQTLQINRNALDIISCRLLSGSTSQTVTVMARFRRRI